MTFMQNRREHPGRSKRAKVSLMKSTSYCCHDLFCNGMYIMYPPQAVDEGLYFLYYIIELSTLSGVSLLLLWCGGRLPPPRVMTDLPTFDPCSVLKSSLNFDGYMHFSKSFPCNFELDLSDIEQCLLASKSGQRAANGGRRRLRLAVALVWRLRECSQFILCLACTVCAKQAKL